MDWKSVAKRCWRLFQAELRGSYKLRQALERETERRIKAERKNMIIDMDILKASAQKLLQDHFEGVAKSVRDDIEEYYEPFSTEFARYSIAYSRGEPHAAKELAHLKAQLQILAGILIKREENRAAETLEAFMVGAAKFGGIMLKALL